MVRKGKLPEDGKGQQGHEALAVGGHLPDVETLVGHVQGLHPLGGEGPQVIQGQKASGAPGVSRHAFRQLSPVKVPGIAFSDALQGLGVGEGGPPLSDPKGAPCGGKGLEPRGEKLPRFPGVPLERFRHASPHRHGNGMSLPGIGHRRSQVLPQRQTPHPGRELRPRRRGPGNGDGGPPLGGHGLPSPSPRHVKGQALGRGTAGVKPLEAAVFPHQGKGIAAEAVRGGFHHREGRRRGHRRIHGVAAFF
ncbi:MAG: hypothetical protein BWY88_00970 [Synergistetes bacterium ADurb.Bin520]|nr:MAG: hypothetical protein BWY88_00970 [Synergistetes bacterium ADurb.Bin520]